MADNFTIENKEQHNHPESGRVITTYTVTINGKTGYVDPDATMKADSEYPVFETIQEGTMGTMIGSVSKEDFDKAAQKPFLEIQGQEGQRHPWSERYIMAYEVKLNGQTGYIDPDVMQGDNYPVFETLENGKHGKIIGNVSWQDLDKAAEQQSWNLETPGNEGTHTNIVYTNILENRFAALSQTDRQLVEKRVEQDMKTAGLSNDNGEYYRLRSQKLVHYTEPQNLQKLRDDIAPENFKELPPEEQATQEKRLQKLEQDMEKVRQAQKARGNDNPETPPTTATSTTAPDNAPNTGQDTQREEKTGLGGFFGGIIQLIMSLFAGIGNFFSGMFSGGVQQQRGGQLSPEATAHRAGDALQKDKNRVNGDGKFTREDFVDGERTKNEKIEYIAGKLDLDGDRNISAEEWNAAADRVEKGMEVAAKKDGKGKIDEKGTEELKSAMADFRDVLIGFGKEAARKADDGAPNQNPNQHLKDQPASKGTEQGR